MSRYFLVSAFLLFFTHQVFTQTHYNLNNVVRVESDKILAVNKTILNEISFKGSLGGVLPFSKLNDDIKNVMLADFEYGVEALFFNKIFFFIEQNRFFYEGKNPQQSMDASHWYELNSYLTGAEYKIADLKSCFILAKLGLGVYNFETIQQQHKNCFGTKIGAGADFPLSKVFSLTISTDLHSFSNSGEWMHYLMISGGVRLKIPVSI